MLAHTTITNGKSINKFMFEGDIDYKKSVPNYEGFSYISKRSVSSKNSFA